MKRAWLGLGGNLGDVPKAMAVALRRLDAEPNVEVVTVSSVYRTPPWGMEDQPWFHNCCAEIATDLAPDALLDMCQAVEREGKRERIVRWGPRTIDVDILMIEGTVLTSETLTVPHPRMLERAFVLVPLADIAGDVSVNGATIAQHCTRIDAQNLETAVAGGDWWKS